VDEDAADVLHFVEDFGGGAEAGEQRERNGDD
jgi:hypothetical protein